MRLTPRSGLAGLASAAVVAALASPLGIAAAQPGSPAPSGDGSSRVTPGPVGTNDHREVGPDVHAYLDKAEAQAALKRLNAGVGANGKANAEVGDTKFFLTLDDFKGKYEVLPFTLRSIGDNIQVWVADDTRFPKGDCRNSLGLTKVTTKQTDAFVDQFDTNMFPKESASFSVPPDKDGSTATLPAQINGDSGTPDGTDDPVPSDYYEVDADQSDDIVTLVSNVRDANYYKPTTPDGQTFIAGFFSTQLNGFFGRNVMSIDAFDWRHRTGENPPDDSGKPAYKACAKELNYTRGFGVPRARDYEGTFAHEYQHLLESYEDPDEVTWVNEGLSDYAQSLVGYVDTSLPPSDPNFDSHIGCFEGFLPRSYGGAENSLTSWQDQGAPEILCDYGATYSFMMYLYSHYGEGFMSFLHRDDANGLQSLDDALNSVSSTKSAQETLHDWAATMAVDAALDAGGTLTGGNADDFSADDLNGQIKWNNPQSYNSKGAPPNGSDYVRFRNKKGKFLSSGQLQSLSFAGSPTLKPDKVEWTVDRKPPGVIAKGGCGKDEDAAGPAALYSGCGADLDRSLATEVSVPASGDQSLTFDANWNIESGYDYAFLQVSDDGGETWTSLATGDTTSEHAPDVDPATVAMLPGFNGASEGFQPQTADLSDYAGEDVLVGFRYVTDPAANKSGIWVRNMKVGGTTVPTNSLDVWKSYSQVNPPEVDGYTVQLIGIDSDTGDSSVATLPLDGDFSVELTAGDLQELLGDSADTVAAVVMMDDPTETVSKYGRYSLKVNGVLQPGG